MAFDKTAVPGWLDRRHLAKHVLEKIGHFAGETAA
jgi:hypothetical protein